MIDLAGRDFFTAEEAAVYCGMELERWKKTIQRHIRPGRFMGKIIYRREDLKRFVERETKWQPGLPWEPDWTALERPAARGKTKRSSRSEDPDINR